MPLWLGGQPAKVVRLKSRLAPTLPTINRHVVSRKNNYPALIESIVFP
jgi:hypothetical protein